MTEKRRPVAFDVQKNSKKTAKSESSINPRPAKSIDIENENLTITPQDSDAFVAELSAMEDASENEVPLKLKKSKFSLWHLIAGAIVTLVSLSFGLWAETLITDLLERSPVIGWLGASALFILLSSFLVLIAREVIGISKLRSVEKLRSDINKALPSPSIPDARRLISRITKVVADCPETALGRQKLKETEGDIIDGDNLLAFAETQLLENLDNKARKMILSSAKRVSVVTAVSPKALIDTGYVLYEMVRLTRQLAKLYGARPGFLGVIKLLRSVVAHLAVTGTVAIGDSLMQQFVSHGIAGKISARLGEGLINGIMTTRFGIVAMELSRPMPFNQLKRPQIKNFLTELTATNEKKDAQK